MDNSIEEMLNRLTELGNKVMKDLEEQHPELKEEFAKVRAQVDAEIEQEEKKNKDKKIYCDCLGDIDYDTALTRRFPFKPKYYDDLDLIEKSDGRIKIDRNKGFCSTALYNLVWQTNGEPAIIIKGIQVGEMTVAAIHYADHPEWFPTPPDIDEFAEADLGEV